MWFLNTVGETDNGNRGAVIVFAVDVADVDVAGVTADAAFVCVIVAPNAQ